MRVLPTVPKRKLKLESACSSSIESSAAATAEQSSAKVAKDPAVRCKRAKPSSRRKDSKELPHEVHMTAGRLQDLLQAERLAASYGLINPPNAGAGVID